MKSEHNYLNIEYVVNKSHNTIALCGWDALNCNNVIWITKYVIISSNHIAESNLAGDMKLRYGFIPITRTSLPYCRYKDRTNVKKKYWQRNVPMNFQNYSLYGNFYSRLS